MNIFERIVKCSVASEYLMLSFPDLWAYQVEREEDLTEVLEVVEVQDARHHCRLMGPRRSLH